MKLVSALLIVAGHTSVYHAHTNETSNQLCERLRTEMKVTQHNVGIDKEGNFIAKGIHTGWCCGPSGEEMADGTPVTDIDGHEFIGFDAWQCIPLPPIK